MTVKPPKGCDVSQIKTDVKMLNSGFIAICTYPNGVELVTVHMNGESTVFCSKPLIKVDDDTYQIPD